MVICKSCIGPSGCMVLVVYKRKVVFAVSSKYVWQKIQLGMKRKYIQKIRKSIVQICQFPYNKNITN